MTADATPNAFAIGTLTTGCSGDFVNVHFNYFPKQMLLQLHATQPSHFIPSPQRLECLEHSFDQRQRAIRAEALGQYVGDANRVHDRANRTAGDDASSGTGWNQHDAGCSETPLDSMWNRLMNDLDLDARPFGSTSRLFDSNRNFRPFAITPANCAATVTDHDQAREAETATALHNTGTTPNLQCVFDTIGAIF